MNKERAAGRYFFLPLILAALTVLPAQTAQAATNCNIDTPWFAPTTPNATNPLFGSYMQVKSNYAADNCDGYATRNDNTGQYQSYPTSQTSDGHDTKAETVPDAQGRPQKMYSNARVAAKGFATWHSREMISANVGTGVNFARAQETLDCVNPGAGPTTVANIPFEFCYHYTTIANGYAVADLVGDAESFISLGMSGGETVTWTSGSSTIKHTVGDMDDLKCNTGTLNLKGTSGTFYLSLNPELMGSKYQQGGPLDQWKRQGVLESWFQITGAPAGVGCTSKSKIFPGADGPTREQETAQKESDQAQSNPCGSSAANPGSRGGGRDHQPSFSDVSYGPEMANNEPSKFVGNPIDFAQGFKVQNETDYSGPGGLNFVRTYRSDGTWLAYNLGAHWRHNFNRTLVIDTAIPAIATLTDENGVVTQFRQKTSGGSWKPYDYEITTKFESLYNSVPSLIGYAYTRNDNTREIYDTAGKLTRIEYLGSVALNLSYDGSGRLSTVTDEHGRSLTFTYDGSSRIATLVTPDGTYTYTYGSNNNLTEVEKPDTKTREYHYEDTGFVNALTGITDERGVRVLTWDYDANGLAVSSEYAGGVGEFTVAYNSDGTVTTTNPLGKQTTFAFQNANSVKKITDSNGLASTNCPASAKLATYTAQGWVESKTDWEGNTTTYVYDSRGLQTSRTEAVGTPQERTITTTWDATFRLPDVITRTGRTTDYDYDAYGRVTDITVTDTTTSETRIWTYTYWSNGTDGSGNVILGRLKQIDGPRTDVTDTLDYAYDGNYNLTTVTNALGQVTEITARDSAGRPTTVEDANNVETDLTYDSNGRLETVTVAPGTALEAVTTLSYDDAGDLTGIELPNGTNLAYTYDNARRVTTLTDDLGNTVNYTLDAAGNVTQTDYEDSGSTLKYTHARTFDELSRLLTSVGAASAWTRSFAYDKNSNLTQYTNANSHATQYAYDALQRLSTSTDALSGVTELTLNGLSQTTGVEDPRNNSTTYTHNAFGDVTQMVSPDTGTTSFVVDKAGNVTQMTDARSVVTNATYDAINRLATVSYPSDSSLNVTLTYDDNPTPGNCGTSIGRLCRTVDASGTTDYEYNDLGQLLEVKEVRGGLTFTTAYEYDLAGVLKKITLPSGREIDYTLNGNGQVSSVAADVNGSATTLASSIAYLPYGPLSGLTYGNSKTLSATYDQDYRPTNRTVSGLFNHTYDTDADGNITQKGVRTYAYDALERMNAEAGGTSASFTYDAIGNRLTEVTGSTTTYTYPSTSSKLSSVGADSYTYDAMGNVTGDGARTYVWSAAGLLKEAKIGGSTVGEYTYDASNLRTKKVAGGNTTHYVHGLGGLLYGEYDNSGNLIREYVWLNGEPLAQIDAGSPEVLTYLHTDHLQTARYGTNAGGSTVWTWDSGAFGKEAATGSATVNLRFPGQYYDSESTLHYNWNRYYNPATGRYISSDPIGLAGGLNTFGYALQSPIVYYDPKGHEVVAISTLCFFGGAALLGVYTSYCVTHLDSPYCLSSILSNDPADQQGQYPQSYPPVSQNTSDGASGNGSSSSGSGNKPATTGMPMPDPNDDGDEDDSEAFDPVEDLEGKSFEEAEQILDQELKGWTKTPLKQGDGVRYYDGKGGSVQLNRGYPDKSWADQIHKGPYAKISRDGKIIRIQLQQ